MIAIQEVYICAFFLATPASDRADPTPEAHSTGVVGTFSYRRSGTNRWRRTTLDPMEFIRRFLQHVLPRGLQKVRHYGFLGQQSLLSIEAVRWLVTLHNGEQFELLAKTVADTPVLPARRCEDCGGQLRVIAIFPRRASAIHDTS